jgi:hypothetical protein
MTSRDVTASEPAERPTCAVGVVIINFRTPDLIKANLGALIPELAPNDAIAVVVDNNSGDGSADAIEAFLRTSGGGRVFLIRSPENAGFSGGNNIGFAALDARYYLALNSDALVRPGAIAALVAAAEKRPDAGMIAPRLEDPDGTAQISCFRFFTPTSEFLRAAETGPLDKLFAKSLVPVPVAEAPIDCDWTSGACFLLRREALDAVGPMDDGFFMYFEDADYCRMLRKAGWRVVYDPAARVVHLRGGSSPVKAALRAKKRPPAYYYASRTRYFRKAYGPLGPLSANLAWLGGRAVAALRRLAGKASPPLCEKESADLWMNFFTPLGDRKAPS